MTKEGVGTSEDGIDVLKKATLRPYPAKKLASLDESALAHPVLSDKDGEPVEWQADVL